MKYKAVYFTALFLLMLITGVFWGTWFTLTRSIESFSWEEFIHIGKVIIANVAVPMRILMPAGILLVLISLFLYDNKRSAAFYMGLLSFALIVITLLITLLVLVPIDNDINEWTAATVPPDFDAIRLKWKNFHAARTFTSLASFAFFSLSIMTSKKESR